MRCSTPEASSVVVVNVAVLSHIVLVRLFSKLHVSLPYRVTQEQQG